MAGKRITSRLKVYITRIGLRDWLVAVDSQKAALKAWDVHRNLFAEGAARVTNDPAHVALAMRTPGLPVAAPGRVVLPQASANVVALSSFRKNSATVDVPAKPKAAVVPQPKRDRSQLDAAERALRDLEREAVRARGEIEKRKRAIEGELEAFDADFQRRRIRLMKRIKREQGTP